MRKVFLLLNYFLFASTVLAADYGKVTTEKIAEGIYLFTTTSYGVGLSGNSVAILSQDGVLVFDTNGLPETADRILKEIRKLTVKPVLYVVNSHWHWDHWAGNQIYRSEFPKVKIITHVKTLEQMRQVEPRWNEEGLKTGLPGYIKQLEQNLQKAKTDQKPETEIRDQEEFLNAAKEFLQQKTSLQKTYPDMTFQDSMTLKPGGREIQLRHARGITVGDTYLYLPKERILITGDLLLSPYPYAIGGTYPADWLRTLQEFAAMNPRTIIPGHGGPQNAEFLQSNIRLFRSILQQVNEAKASGKTLDQTKVTLGEQTEQLASLLGISDQQIAAEFRAYFLDVFVARAFRELDSPLSDFPDGM
jgi:cyclase